MKKDKLEELFSIISRMCGMDVITEFSEDGVGIEFNSGFGAFFDPERNDFEIYKVVTIPGTYWDPPDVSIVPIEDTGDPVYVIKRIILLEAEEAINNRLESIYMEDSYHPIDETICDEE